MRNASSQTQWTLEFSLNELVVQVVLNNASKAPGLNRVPNEFFNAPNLFLKNLLGIYKNISKKNKVPETLKTFIIFPLRKNGYLI